ncbi:MAG: UDP-N-acetylmuramoyl-tripeptide--D-alanyl-D-alanine ligase [Oligoflexia bacterium]|nr:UDP-N-acetylmuramoyl-tripeptide--D-alanyl-D-alanine ligase [Oligoflexia bacterium]
MALWTIDDLLKGTGGNLQQRGSRILDGVGTDTRADLTGKVFFALRGENFDAHEFAGAAVQKGAAAIIIDKPVPKVSGEVTIIRVEDTLKALQSMGLWHRSQWQGKLVGLTGSNGKTTTKEFCHTILSQKFSVLSTKGNLNNHIGVPLTLLELRTHHKIAVVEMGMNHAGEITELVKLSKPDIVLVTNVGRAHIEHFGNLEKIAQAKEEIYEAAPDKATRIYNLDNQYTAMMRARAPGGCKVFSYSSYARDVDVSFKEKFLTLDFIEVQGVIQKDPGMARIPSFGRQQIANAMAASCVALACGVEAPLIWKGLALCKSGWGRGQLVDLENGAQVLFDAYNANPDSCMTAIDNFSKLAARGRKYIVFGDMLELGDLSKKMHQEVGEALATVQPEGILLIGEHAHDVEFGLRAKGFSKNIVISKSYEEKLARSFGTVLQTGDIVLIKGSRGMKLERVLESWRPINFLDKH